MMTNTNRARWAVLIALGLAFPAACTDWKNELLQPQNPGLIDNSAVSSPAAALALKVGALGKVKRLVSTPDCGECLWQESGNLADEFKNADFQPDRQDIDQRQIATNNGILSYSQVTQIRGYLRDALNGMTAFLPTNNADIAELWMNLGFTEMQMAETYCNGIPLGKNTNGSVDYSDPSFKPLTNAEVYAVASAHLDTALALVPASATDANSVAVRAAALIVKARILVDLGQQAQAAALVPTSAVPTSFQYLWTTSPSSNSDDNGIWFLNNSVSRVTVADSFDIFNGSVNIIKNNLPFASANDPRVPVVTGKSQNLQSEDGTTPLFLQQIWKGRDDPMPMVSGLDARLIEAEGKLKAGDIAGMMTILNSLRAAPPKDGNFQPAAMAALPTPASQDAATSLYFREKAFWTFGRGQRLGDLRRLIRQYGRTQDNVFPTGVYFKGGQPYGKDVNFPVPDGEKVNPQFTGCIDRNA
ncbi:MAG TPA: hypothetical protein VN706_02975 [Gemmatimonadaceae bacterium]|nr:hypothetical protein [Gemmatimonadaceae bacterium]